MTENPTQLSQQKGNVLVDISPVESPSGLVGSRGNLSSSPFLPVFPDAGSLLRQYLPSGAG